MIRRKRISHFPWGLVTASAKSELLCGNWRKILLISFEDSLAQAELRLILASLLWTFDIMMSEETDEDWLDQNVYL